MQEEGPSRRVRLAADAPLGKVVPNDFRCHHRGIGQVGAAVMVVHEGGTGCVRHAQRFLLAPRFSSGQIPRERGRAMKCERMCVEPIRYCLVVVVVVVVHATVLRVCHLRRIPRTYSSLPLLEIRPPCWRLPRLPRRADDTDVERRFPKGVPLLRGVPPQGQPPHGMVISPLANPCARFFLPRSSKGHFIKFSLL